MSVLALFHCMVRLGSALFAFPLQFSVALEWAGYSHVAIAAPPLLP